MNLKSNEVIMVVGKRGFGKSTLVRWLLRRFQRAGVDVYVYNTSQEREYQPFPHYTPKIIDDLMEFEGQAEKVWKKGNLVFVVEEVDLFASSHFISPMLKRLVSAGRHRNIGVICTTRRVWDVHKLICSQVHHWFFFQNLELGYSIVYLKKFIGDIAEKLKDIPPYYFLYVGANEVKMFKPLRV